MKINGPHGTATFKTTPNDFGEIVVRLLGKPKADYHTTDIEDARATAQAMVAHRFRYPAGDPENGPAYCVVCHPKGQ